MKMVVCRDKNLDATEVTVIGLMLVVMIVTKWTAYGRFATSKEQMVMMIMMAMFLIMMVMMAAIMVNNTT